MHNGFRRASRAAALLAAAAVLMVAQPASDLRPNGPQEAGGLSLALEGQDFEGSEPPPAAPGRPTLGERAPAALVERRGSATYVPILLYHYVRVNPDPRDRVGFSLSTVPAMFRAQMQYLAAHGFHVLRLPDTVEAIRLHHPLPPRSVVLTFDDGYADFFTAAIPELRRHGFTATDFVITGRVGGWSYMTWSQVRAADGMGFTIGAHTVNHVALSAQSRARAMWEMQQSKLALEAALGHPVVDFAYPYGSFNGLDEALARQLGFETAVSTRTGAWHTPAALMHLERLRVGGGMSLTTFARLVGGPAPSPAELRTSG